VLAWLPLGAETLRLQLDAAAEAAPLALLVAAVALSILVYAEGYIGCDDARNRFFGLMALFLGAMLLLVFAADLLTLLNGWEEVGLCSKAMIGFWHGEGERVTAGNRAYLSTRSADLGLYLAAMDTFAGAGSFDFDGLADMPAPWLHVAAAGLIMAAAGKSAQLPFSGWLSGAMLGPTPVSALLHSATMVAAGVILLIKATPMLDATGWALPLVLWLGVAGALAAGVIALYQDDLKQVIAASTVSQYGFMFAALGAGGVASTSAYLANHAAFKALLFLVAGVLLHQGLRYISEMGGLGRKAPLQAALFALGALALAGIPPTGGFFAKEALLARVEEHSLAAFAALLLATVLSAAYIGRAWLGAFSGEGRTEEVANAKEPGLLMLLPGILLAVALFLFGALAIAPWKHGFQRALSAGDTPPFSITGAALSLGAALAGALAVFALHRRNAFVPITPLLGARSAALAREWFGLVRGLDRIGAAAIHLGTVLDRLDRLAPADRIAGVARRFAAALGRFDENGVDRALARAPTSTSFRLAGASAWTDRRIWDGAIALMDAGLDRGARLLSAIQEGLLHRYYAHAAIGAAALLVYAFIVLRP
jgi:NADH:ubiquinone oxidoreductase subunit 5 (subunit L)/multisubunit Na+/H+ antiporter MnhA subunit